MIEVAAQLHKRNLPALASMRGKVNDAVIKVGGEDHEIGSLLFTGFAGRHIGEQVYGGYLQFVPCYAAPADELPEAVDFNTAILVYALEGIAVMETNSQITFGFDTSIKEED